MRSSLYFVISFALLGCTANAEPASFECWPGPGPACDAFKADTMEDKKEEPKKKKKKKKKLTKEEKEKIKKKLKDAEEDINDAQKKLKDMEKEKKKDGK